MTSAPPTPMHDDHGDQFPGAVPPRTPSAVRPGAEQRLVRMRAAYVEKVNAAIEADREGLAYELAERTFIEEVAGDAPLALSRQRRTAGRRSPDRGAGERPRSTMSRMGRFTRRSLDRFDRYTIDVFNPGHPYRSHADRSDRPA
jgi:hypothetical protein